MGSGFADILTAFARPQICFERPPPCQFEASFDKAPSFELICQADFMRCCTCNQGEATAALAAIAVGNRTRLPEHPLSDMGNSTAVSVNLWNVVKHPRLRFRLLIMTYAWCALSILF